MRVQKNYGGLQILLLRFENILQTPEYLSKVEKIFLNQNITFLEEVDCMTETLSNILVEGATLVNNSQSIRLSKICSKKSKSRKKAYHPK